MALKVAVVGMGGIGMTHARCYKDNPLSELVEAVSTSDDYAWDFFLDNKVGTWRGFPIVGAGFQAHINGRLVE